MGALDFSKDAEPDNSGAQEDFSSGSVERSSSAIRRLGADPLISLAKGVIGVPELVTGLYDIATLGQVGKAAEKAGFRPAEAKKILDSFLSPEQQAANQRVADTKGFFPTVGAALSNPSTIAHSVIESVPSIGAGGAIGRVAMPALASAFPKAAPVVAGALGEGVASAG